MKRSFIVDYTISGDTNLPAIAEEILQDLQSLGHPVISVKPFAPKGTAKPLAPPILPP